MYGNIDIIRLCPNLQDVTRVAPAIHPCQSTIVIFMGMTTMQITTIQLGSFTILERACHLAVTIITSVIAIVIQTIFTILRKHDFS